LKIVIVAVLLAGMFGGFYAALPHIPELQQMFHISNDSSTDQDSNTPVSPVQPSSPSTIVTGAQAPAVGSLAIVGAGMYYQEPSFVVVRNSGNDAVLVRTVSYGQTSTPISNLRVEAGGQQHIAIPHASGVPGSSYLLQVQGISASSGKSVTAQVSAILNEHISRLELSNAQIIVAGDGKSNLQMTMRSSGGDPISIISIECGTIIPGHLWQETGQVVLQPGENKGFNIPLDSTDCAGANPQGGSTRNVTVRGENSLGKVVSAVTEFEVVVQVQHEEPEPETTPIQLIGTNLPMGQAVVHVQSAGHYVLTFEVVNTHYQDVRIDSLRVNGAEIPGWGGSTLLAQTSTMSTVTTSQGITSSDIGSVAEIVILAHLSTSSQYGDPATSFYGVASAPVLGP
jgi:hypothetical protein